MLFPSKEELLKFHVRLIDQFGGTHGLRDEGLFESALLAAQNRHYYEGADEVVCAATYAFHLTMAHAFIDGNKRIAAAAAECFLELNDRQLNATKQQIVHLFLAIGAGQLNRDDVAKQFAQWVAAIQPGRQ